MPYVLAEGEHSCGRYHYGNQTLVRDCCVEDCRKYAALTVENALTTSHPAYRMYIASYNSLTDAERQLVPDVMWGGRANQGFVVR